jgi:sulfur carrier protein ThiS
MSTITLIVIPGPGARTVNHTANMTLSDLACQENLHGRDIIINGSGILPNLWATTTIPANAEIFATGSVKGNTNQITLIVIPGSGARTVEVPNNSTISDLACQENLHGRDIIVNGQGIPVNQWTTFGVSAGMEIFATGSVKGN